MEYPCGVSHAQWRSSDAPSSLARLSGANNPSSGFSANFKAKPSLREGGCTELNAKHHETLERRRLAATLSIALITVRCNGHEDGSFDRTKRALGGSRPLRIRRTTWRLQLSLLA
jgi:hypothetical protein